MSTEDRLRLINLALDTLAVVAGIGIGYLIAKGLGLT